MLLCIWGPGNMFGVGGGRKGNTKNRCCMSRKQEPRGRGFWYPYLGPKMFKVIVLAEGHEKLISIAERSSKLMLIS